MKKIVSSIIAAFVFLFLLSVDPIHLKQDDGVVPGIQLEGLVPAPVPAYAGTTNSGAWEYVRATATFVRGITTSINDILALINSSPLVAIASYKGSVPGTGYKIDWNGSTSVVFTRGTGINGALLGDATYTKSLRIFDATSNLLLVEMYFNAASAGGGLLVRWEPSRIAPLVYTGTGLGECQVSGTTGSRTMICSFSNGPFVTPPPNTPTWATAIIKAQETGGPINISALSKTSASFTPGACAASSNYYFPLAYIVTNSTPYNTTGKFGFNIGVISSGVCGLGANPFNYGLFNINANPSATDIQQYFYQDGVAAADIPAGYPSATDVDTLFSTIKTSGSVAGDIGKDIIDLPLNITFQNPTAPVW